MTEELHEVVFGVTERAQLVIDTPSRADWAIREIKAIDTEYERMIAVAKEQVQTLLAAHRKSRGFWEEKLAAFMQNVQAECRKTETQEIYKLASGTLRIKHPKPEWIRHEQTLLTWARTHAERFVKVVESLNWADLKKTLSVLKDGTIVDERGQAVEGILLEDRPATFEVEIAKE